MYTPNYIKSFTIIFIFLAWTTCSYAQNLLSNPEFENGTTNWSVQAPASASTDTPSCGTYGAYLGDGGSMNQATFSVTPGCTYTLTFDGRRQAVGTGWAYISMSAYDDSGSSWVLLEDVGMDIVDGVWNTYTFEIIAPANTTLIDCWMGAGSGGEMRIDCMSLTQTCGPSCSSSTSVTSTLNASSDDAEENGSGVVNLTSSDLELVYDGSNQVVGIRFTNLTIPQGSTISSARIEFEVDESNWDVTNLTFYGQDIDDAPTFTTATSNISNRIKTSASVPWHNLMNWDTVDEKWTSPELYLIAQEIIDRSGWSSGNDMVFIIEGTGERTAESFDGEATAAPSITITYCSNNAPPPCTNGLLTNQGFENGLTDWGNSSNASTTSDAHSGSTAALLSSGNGGIWQNITTSAGETHSVEAYIKRSGNNDDATLGIDFYDSSNNFLNGYYTPITATSYQAHYVSATAPPNAAYANAVVWKHAGNDQIFIDDVCAQDWIINPATCNNTTCELEPSYSNYIWSIDDEGGQTYWMDYDRSDMIICDNGNGTLTIEGNIINGRDAEWGSDYNEPCGAQDGWHVEIQLFDKQTWEEFQGNYVVHSNCPDAYLDLEYWDCSGTYTGIGCNTGRVINILGPSAGYRFQIGTGGNNHNCGYGMSTWFQSVENGSSVNSDIYSNIDSVCYNNIIPPEICGNNIDDDYDGYVDAADLDCMDCCVNMIENAGFENYPSAYTFPYTFHTIPAEGIDASNFLTTNWIAASSAGNRLWLINDNQNQVNNPEGDIFAYIDGQYDCAQLCGIASNNCDISPLLCEAWGNGDSYQLCFDAAAWNETITNAVPMGAGTQTGSQAIVDLGRSNGTTQLGLTTLPASSSFTNLNWVHICVNFTYSASNPIETIYLSQEGAGGMVVDNLTMINTSTCTLPTEICNNNIDDDGDGKIDCLDGDCDGSPLCSPVSGQSCGSRVTDGLQVLYDFNEGSGSIAYDVSGVGSPLDLTIANTSNTNWTTGGLSINTATILESAGAANKVSNAVITSNEITLEAWVKPHNSTQSGPARIMTISESSALRNFTLGQETNQYAVRLKTTTTGTNGLPTINGTPLTTSNEQHVVYTWDGSTNVEKLYIDGIEAYSGTRTGNTSNWVSSYKFAIANELTNDRAWLGEIKLAAVYNEALSAAEVLINFNEGSECLDEICDNNIDDDGDGLIDCLDDDCDSSPSCDSTNGSSCGSRVTDGLQVLYDFEEGSGSVANDVSGVGAPVDLTIANTGNTSWTSGGLSLNSATILESASAANKVSNAIIASNEITLEAWVKPDNITQSGPARILTLSKDSQNRNFTLGQEGSDYAVRMKTSTTGNNGYPTIYINPLSNTTVQHIVYTWDGNTGIEKFYINGVQQFSGTRTGNTSTWDASNKLAIGNELDGNRDWLGEIKLAAVYSKSLSIAEILTNYNEGPECAGAPSTTTYDCSSGVTIDHYGASCDSGSVTVNVPNTSNVNQTIMEIVYKGCYPGSSVTATSSTGNITLNEVVISGGSSSVYVYRATVSGGVTNISHAIACGSCSSSNGLQSLVVMAERNVAYGSAYNTVLTENSGYCGIETITIPISTDTEPRDIEVILPFSELTDDGRYLTVTATSNTGSASASETIYGPDLSLGSCCFAFVELKILNVPANSTYITIEIITDVANSPTGSCGQSWVVSGTVFTEIECPCVDVVANAGPNQTLCVGNATYEKQLLGAATAGTAPYTYLWSPATGLSNPNIAQPMASPNVQTTYTLTVTGSDGCSDTDEVIVNVNNNFTDGGTIGSDESQCNSYDPAVITSTTLPSGGNGGTNTIYLWQHRTYNCTTETWSSWTNISGATNETYDPSTITQTTQYRRLARRSYCFTWAYSNIVLKEVVENFSDAGSISGAESSCGAFDPAEIINSADPSGGCGGTVQHLWRKREFDCINDTWGAWSTIGGASAATYDPATITVTTQFRRQSRRTTGCTPGWLYATPIVKTVVENITDTGAIDGTESQCGAYDPTIITLSTLPSGGCGADIEYRWYERTQDCGTGTWNPWILQPNSNTSTWDPGQITQTTHYAFHTRRGDCDWVPGPGIIKTVTENFTDAGEIAGDETVCGSFDPTEITSVSDPSGGCGTFWGIWQSRTFDCASETWSAWINITGSENLMSYDPPTITSTTEYRRLYTRTGCNPNYVITNTVLKEVLVHYTNGGTIGSNESFCGAFDPQEITSISDPVGGCGGTMDVRWYQWERDCNTGNWITPATLVSGANTLSYDPPTISVSTRYRRYARRGSECNGTNGTWMVSNYIYKYVDNDISSSGTISPDQEACGSFDPTLLTGTEPSGQCSSQTITYQWQERNGYGGAFTDIVGETNQDFDPPLLSVNKEYRRVATTGSCGNLYSNIVTMTINNTPTIDLNNEVLCEGESVDLEPEICVTFPDLSVLRPLETSGWGTQFNSGGNKLVGDGSLCFELTNAPNTSYQMMGLTSDPNANGSYNTIDYAIYVLPNASNNRLNIYENGSNKGQHFNSGTTSMVGSTICVRRTGTTIEYLKDDVVIYTSLVASNADLYYDNSFHSSGAQNVTLENIKLCGDIDATFDWSTGASTKDITVSSSDDYTITVTDINGCSSSLTQTTSVNDTTAIYCQRYRIGYDGTWGSWINFNGDCTIEICEDDGLWDFQFDGGPDNDTGWVWSDESGNVDSEVDEIVLFSNIGSDDAGIYTGVFTNANTCVSTLNFEVIVNPSPTADAGDDQTVCEGASITLTATGGDTYEWSTGDQAAQTTVTVNTTTTYEVTVTNSDGCESSDQVTITTESTPTATATGETICSGETATLIGSVSGGLGTATYQWQSSNNESIWTDIPGATNINYTTTALQATTYFRLVATYSGTGCGSVNSNSAEVVVELNSMALAITATEEEICINTSTTLVVNENTATGGLVDYSGWTTGTGSNGDYNANGAVDENHRILDTDPWGNETVVWEARPEAASNADGGWNHDRFDIDHTKLYRVSVWVNRKVMGTNGRFYMGARGYGSTNGLERITNGAVTTNPYFYVSTTPPSDFGVDEWVLVVGHIFPSDHNGSSNHSDSGRYTIDSGKYGNISYDYKWLPESTESLHRSYLYYCTDVSVRQQWVYPRFDVVDGTEPSIDNLLNGFDVNGGLGEGADWEWYTGSCGGTSIGTGPSIIVNPNTTTTYYVRGEGECGNSDCEEITIIVNDPPVASASNNGPLTCGTTTVTLTASPSGLTYEWSDASTQETLDVNAIGTYNVTVTDNNGCSATASTTVTEDLTEPTAGVNSPSICIGDDATITATGGVSYLWNTNDSTPSISVNPATTSTYTVTVTGANGCTAEATSTVTVNPLPHNAITKLRDINCSHSLGYVYATEYLGGALSYSDNTEYISGGGSCGNNYISTTGVTPYSILAHNLANSVTAGNTYEFSFKYKSSGSGSKYARILFYDASWTYISGVTEYINVNNPNWTDHIVSGVAPVNAANVQIGIIISGPNTVDTDCWDIREQGSANAIYENSFENDSPYQWTGPNGIAGSARGIYISTPGTYTVTMTDLNTGCSNTNSVNVIEDLDPPHADASNNGPLTCANTTVDLTASSNTASVNYAWSNGANTATTSITDPGVYTVTVTDPSNGCTETATTTVAADTTATPVFCQRYRLGYDGVWGAWTNFAGNCTVELCEEDGLWDIQLDGGPDINTGWVWTDEDGNVDSEVDEAVVFSNIGSNDAGTYTGILTNEFGCTSEVNFEVVVHTNPIADAGSDQSICIGTSATLTASGGSDYLWDDANNSTSASITVSPNTTTTYTVTVTDNNLCSSTDAVTITVDSITNMALTVSDSLSCNLSTVQLTATPSGLNYNWTGPNGFNSSISNPNATEAGMYYVTITDTNTSCFENDSIEVILKSNITINSLSQDCNDNDITLSYTATGTSTQGWVGIYNPADANTEFLVWQWLPTIPGSGSVTFQNHNLTEGTYEMRIFSGSGYELCQTLGFDYAPLPTADAGDDHEICFGDPAVTLGTASQNNITYQWSTGGSNITGATASTYNVTPAASTDYTLTVTATDGCTATDEVTVVVKINPTDPGSIQGDEIQCESYDPTIITSTAPATGSSGASINYIWQISEFDCDTETWSAWVNIPNSNTEDYDPPFISVTSKYRRAVGINGCTGWTSTNEVIKEVVVKDTVNGTIDGDESSCEAYDPTLITSISEASGGCGGTQNITWIKRSYDCATETWSGWTTIIGANDWTYDPEPITVTHEYIRRVSRYSGCSPVYNFSNIVTKEVVINYNDAGQIAGDQEACGAYDPSNITSAVDPSGGCGGSPMYIWQSRTYDCTNSDYGDWVIINGVNSLAYNPSTISVTTQYQRLSIRLFSCASSYQYSNIVTKTVAESLTDGGEISGNESKCTDYNSTEIISLSEPSGGCDGTLIYEWRKRERDCANNTWGSFEYIANSNSASYNPGLVTVTTEFQRRARRGNCPWVYSTRVYKEVVDNSNFQIDAGDDMTMCEAPVYATVNTSLEGSCIVPTSKPMALWNTGDETFTIEITSPGTYTVTVTIGDCSLTDSVTVTEDDSISVDAGEDVEICDGTSVTLTATETGASTDCSVCCVNTITDDTHCTTGLSYAFGINDMDPNTPVIWFSTTSLVFEECADGTATLSGAALNQTTGTTVTLDIAFSGKTTTPPLGSPRLPNTCNNNQSATGWIYYPGFIGTISENGNDYVISKRGDAVQIGNGANNISSNYGIGGWFTIYDHPTWAIGDFHSVIDPNACTESSNASQAISYEWSNGETTESITTSTAGDYIVTVTDCNGCSATDLVSVTITEADAEIILPAFSCAESSSTIEATVIAGASYSWDFSGGVTADGDEDDAIEEVSWPDIYVDTTLTITLTVTSSNGCISTATETLILSELPEDDIQGDMMVIENHTNGLYEGPDADTYAWSIIEGDASITGSSTSQTVLVDFLTNNTILQLIVNAGTCPDTLYQNINILTANDCYYYDNFDQSAYNNSHGSQDWSSTPWVEFNDNDNASSGNVKVSGKRLFMVNPNSGPTVYIERAVNLLQIENPILTFDLKQKNSVSNVDVFEVDIFDGANWNNIYSLNGQKPSGFNPSFDISVYANANTKIRFALPQGYEGNSKRIDIDDVAISGECILCALESVSMSNENTCEGYCEGSITVDVNFAITGPFNITYTFEGVEITSGPYSSEDPVEITGLCEGTYSDITITRTDNACFEIWPASMTISETGAEWEHVTLADNIDNCDGVCNGSFIVDANHGLTGEFEVSYTFEGVVTTLGPYDFAGDILIDDLCAGTYSDITITGTETGCSDVWPEDIVIEIERPEASIVSFENDECQESMGAAIIAISGGNGPYVVDWHSEDGTHSGSENVTSAGQIEINGLIGGNTYCFTVTDINGCEND